MNCVPFIKCEVLCIILLIMIFIYSVLIKKEMVRKEFNRMLLIAICQLLIEGTGIILLNVQNKSLTHLVINRIVSAVDIFLVLIFCYTFMKYISMLVFSSSTARKISIVGVIPVALFAFLAVFNDFDYMKGTSIYYIGGVYVGLWLIVCMTYIVAAIIFLIMNRLRIERIVVTMFEMISFVMVVLFYIQIVMPEIYLLGCNLTLVIVATYLSIENNADSNSYRMSIDIETGVKNKKAYKEDISKLNNKYFRADSTYEKITFVLFDIVNMKSINEKHGLVVGDDIIAKTADIISKNLKNVHNIYRIRGDVFAAVYLGEDESDIITGCKLVGTEVARTNKEMPFDYYVAVSIVSMDNTAVDNMEEIINLAGKKLDKQKDVLGKKMNA